jgi:hypothetical protein
MTVTVNGEQLYEWPVSTGGRGYDTPSGTFKPFRMEIDHTSDEYDNAPMPAMMLGMGKFEPKKPETFNWLTKYNLLVSSRLRFARFDQTHSRNPPRTRDTVQPDRYERYALPGKADKI